MKKLILFIGVVMSIGTSAQTWSLDKGHSKIGFTVTHHMISEVDGYFKTFTAKLSSAKEDFSDAVFELSAEVNSVNTENETRDKDLKTPKFFDAEKFPNLIFKSTSFKKVSGTKYQMVGDLTIRDITKSITMDVTLLGPEPHPRTKLPVIGIKATCTILRKDFGVGIEHSELLLNNEIQLRATGEFRKD